MIKLTNLSLSYGSHKLLESFSLQTSQNLTILGANGSGKSTLAKAICSLIKYDGEIYIESKNVKTLSLKERASLLCYIPTKLAIYDEFITLEAFVLQGRFLYKKNFFDYSEHDKKIAFEMMQSLQIEHLSKRSIMSLSSGEQQLSLIAQALAQESKIIIFDEPTANLDPYNAKIIAGHIKRLEESHQVILITHDLHLASFMNHSVLFLKDANALYFEKDFFNDTRLERLYGVKFNALVAEYD